MGRAAVTIAELLAAVDALSAADLAELLDRMAGMQCVEDAGWRVRERRESPERYPERNAKIRAAHQRGLHYGQIAKQFGMTRGNVRNIIKRGEKVCTPNECTQAMTITLEHRRS